MVLQNKMTTLKQLREGKSDLAKKLAKVKLDIRFKKSLLGDRNSNTSLHLADLEKLKAEHDQILKSLKESRGHSIITKKLKTMELLKTGGITKNEEPAVEKAHKELDTELHKQYGKRPEEMKEEREFKVGDQVYHPLSGKTGTVKQVYDNHGIKSYLVHGLTPTSLLRDKQLQGDEFLGKHLKLSEGIVGDIAKKAGSLAAGAALTAGLATAAIHKNPEDTKSHLQKVSANTQSASQSSSAQKKLADMRAKFAERQKQNKG